ncbi:MAG: hypothetical protein ABSE51_06260 [Terracidiphilus sp.]
MTTIPRSSSLKLCGRPIADLGFPSGILTFSAPQAARLDGKSPTAGGF